MPRLAPLAASGLGLVILLVWREIHPAQCFTLVIPLGVAAVLTAGLREGALRHRECAATCYFEPGSVIARLLRSRTLVTVYSLVLAMVLSTALALSLLSWGPPELALLALDALLIIPVLYLGFLRNPGRWLGLRRETAYVVAKGWTVAINVVGLMTTLAVMQLHSPPPRYLDESDLGVSMANASRRVESECAVVDTLARLHLEKEAFAWWLMIRASNGIEDRHLRWAAWIVFLVSGSLSVWGFSRFSVQLVDLAHRTAGKP
jgi:hypothetical protein